MIEVDEAGGRRELRWDELRLAVGGVAGALRERGIGPGDVVAGYLPNCTEAVVAYLACASVGRDLVVVRARPRSPRAHWIASPSLRPRP